MNTNKKIWLVFVIFVIVPIVLPFLFRCLSEGKYFYEYSCSATSFIIFSFVPLFGGILIAYLNHRGEFKSKIWCVISSIIILVSIAYLLILNSLSHFGF